MKLAIGETIKRIRKAKDITQEALAEILGVSCQSVSRWELGICYPDMELLPVLAEIFGISVDQLLGVDAVIEQKQIDAYLERFQAAINIGQIDDCIAIAREGVSNHPNSYALLNKLMYALFVSGSDDANIPDWKKNMERHDAEIVSLGERIIKYCLDQDIRLEATARLAFHHCEMGRRDIGRTIYNTLPSQEFCRENQIWWGLEEEEKLPFLRNAIRENYETLAHFIRTLGGSQLLPDPDSIAVFRKLFELESLIYDGNPPLASWRTARVNIQAAQMYARTGNHTLACRHLACAVEAAKAFDSRPEVQTNSSILLGNVTIHKSDYETADTRGLCEIIRDVWLAHSDFDSLRSTDAFKEILVNHLNC